MLVLIVYVGRKAFILRSFIFNTYYCCAISLYMCIYTLLLLYNLFRNLLSVTVSAH